MMRFSRWALAAAILAAPCIAAPAADKALATFTVEAGKHERIDAPVGADLPAGVDLGAAPRLVETTGGKAADVPCQAEPGKPPRLWWVLAGKTPAGAKRTFELRAGAAAAVPGGRRVEARKGDEAIDIIIAGADGQDVGKVLRYWHAPLAPPEKVSPRFARSAFIHPAWSPAGQELTDNFPRDHYHHKGIWMPWTKAKFRGKAVDFWNLAGGTGTVRFKEYADITSGAVFGGFAALHEHVVWPGSKDEAVALNEMWLVRAWNVGGPQAGYWLWDVLATQSCATADPVELPKYHYGGMGYRGARGWIGETAYTITSEGKDRNNGDGTRARWCALGGEDGGKAAGGIFLAHPDNFRFPEPMRLWAGKKNVFVGWNPSRLGDWKIEPGKDLAWRYRFVAHDGKLDIPLAERLWTDFAEPPQVAVTAGS